MSDTNNPAAQQSGQGQKPAGDPAISPAAGGGQPPAAGQSVNGGNPPSAYRPDGLPDHLFGTSDRETIDKLHKAHSGFRDQIARLEPLPKDAAGYDFQWSDKVKPFMADTGDDKFLNGLRDVALSSGVNNAQASAFLSGAMELMLDLKLVDEPVDVKAELAKLVPADAVNLPEPERNAAIQRRVSTNLAFMDGLVAEGFSRDAADAIKAELAGFPELHQLVEHMRNGTGVKPALGGTPPVAVTQASLRERNADPRNNPNNIKYDKDFAAETQRQYQQFYGTGSNR